MSHPRKPHDIGNGLVCASFGGGGEWLSLATVDPGAGFVELNGLPLFDPEWLGNDAAIHRYRSWMRRDEHAFLHVEAGRATISSRQDAQRDGCGIVQRLVLRASPFDRPTSIHIRFKGRLSPPVLAETSGAASDPGRVGAAAAAETRLEVRQGTLEVAGSGPSVIVQAWLRRGDAEATSRRADRRIGWTLLRRRMPSAVATVAWPRDATEVHLDLACTFDLGVPEPPAWLAHDSPAVAAPEAHDAERPLHVPARLVRPLGRLTQRARSYVRSCTALQVDGASRCLLSDHRILPLASNAEAYWQARLLLATWTRGGHEDDGRAVADHLRWLFLRCERPDARWGVSHEADGRRLDGTYLPGPQLYPLIELADFASVAGRLPALPQGDAWSELVPRAWAPVEAGIDPAVGLLRSVDGDGSTPAGERMADQVLLWQAATALARLAPSVGLDRARLTDVATRVRLAVQERLVVDSPLGGRMWAGGIDADGRADRAIDALDLPIFLAPLWRFCKASDRVWRDTIRFAFDPANPRYVDGEHGGLGSWRTPGTWTLGDVERWLALGLLGDQAAAETALGRLVDVAFDDAMLPEAYDPEGSGSVVRHWFAWPGAALGALSLTYAARQTGD